MSSSKIVLGSAQFGLQYGINNKVGVVSTSEVSRILALAFQNGIDVIDTASAYGMAEEVLGQNDISSFKVISKIPSCSDDQVERIFNQSLTELGITRLYGYLFHSFDAFRKSPSQLGQIQDLQSQGLIEKVGFSLYYPEELDFLLDNYEFQILQIPYNLFDRRFEPYFEELKKRNIELHVRSVFLQGLFFKDPNSLEGYMSSFIEPIKKVNNLCSQLSASIQSLALSFVLSNPSIDKLILGLESSNQLIDNLNSINVELGKNLHQMNLDFNIDPLKLIPSNWKS